MSPGRARLVTAIAASALVTTLTAGCGHGGGGLASVGAGPGRIVIEAGLPYLATKNTTRVAAADPVTQAAAVAAAVYPSGSQDTRPQVVALAPSDNWQESLAAASLMSAPLRAPLLFATAGSVPSATTDALTSLGPVGSAAAGGAQLIRIGAVPDPGGLSAKQISGTNPFAVAAAIDRFVSTARGGPSGDVVVVSADAPAFAMPAASWAAKSGDPILYVTRDSVPPETRAAIASRSNPHIYVLGPPSAVGAAALSQLSALGTVKRVGASDPVNNAISFARYLDGGFGWGIVNPGHGLVFASDRQTLAAAAAAPLSASGTFGPLLLVADPGHLPNTLRKFLLDIQPGYAEDPVRGVYNHAWLVGDEHAISSLVQSRIDALLEITAINPTRTSP